MKRNSYKIYDISDLKVLDLYTFLNTEEFSEFARELNINAMTFHKEGEHLKLRRWKSSFRLPSKIICVTNVIRYGSSRSGQQIIKRVLYGRIEEYEDFRKRWTYKDNQPRYFGGQVPYFVKEGWIWVKLHDNWIYDRVIPKPEDFSFRNKWIYLRVPKGCLGISYVSGDFHSHLLFLPSLLLTDSFFFEGLGLQQGDGTQSPSDVHVTFTNGCFDLLKHQIDWFEKLRINKLAIRAYPEIPLGKEIEFDEMSKRLSRCGITMKQFRSGKSNLPNTKNVLIQLVFHHKFFKVVYLYLLERLKYSVFEDVCRLKSYLRGLFAAEGSVSIRKNSGIIRYVKISASSEERRLFIRRCLRKIGIIPVKDELTKGSEAVKVGGFHNYQKLEEFNILKLHPEKQQKFIKGLGNYKFRSE